MNAGTKPRPRAARCSAFTLFAACALIVLSSFAPAAAKAWRGIVPLVSTRADVERLLGQPARKGDGWHYYDFRDEAAVVWFGDGKCDPWGLRWDVPEGTATHVGVVPKRRVKVSTLLDLSAVRTMSIAAGYAVHHDDRAGLTIEAQNGFVAVATYEPSDAASRRCPAKEKLTHFPHHFPFDQYGRIPREDEWARLDHFANELIESPTARGVIVAYGGRRGQRGEAKSRGARAKDYLVRTRRIEPWRITVIDGGHREEPTTELNLFIVGGPLTPAVAPTVAPSEVTIIEPATVRRGQGRNEVGRRKN